MMRLIAAGVLAIALTSAASAADYCPASPFDDAFQAPEFAGLGPEPAWPAKFSGLANVVAIDGRVVASMQGAERCRWLADHMTRRNAMLRRCFGESIDGGPGYGRANYACP